MVQQVGVQATKELTQSATSPSILDSIIGLLPLGIVLLLVIVGVVLFLKWFMNKQAENRDIYTKDYKKTIEQCKLLKNSKYLKPVMGLPLWLASKGTPIFMNYPATYYSKEYTKKDADVSINRGEMYKLGNYAGHCTTTDGCFNIMVKSSRDKIFFIFPKTFVVKLRQKHKQKIIDSDDRKKTKVLDVPPDSYTLSDDIITINAVGLEKIGNYYYTVNIDDQANVVDTKPFAYNDMIDISTQKQLMDLGRNMAIAMEESVRGNPLVQFLKKTDTGLGSE